MDVGGGKIGTGSGMGQGYVWREGRGQDGTEVYVEKVWGQGVWGCGWGGIENNMEM